jgi:predicted transcriptional regulator
MPQSQDPDSGPRRRHGELESAVLAVLWDADEALTPAQVRDLLADGERDSEDGGGGELAYTTVVTILSRLHEKRSLVRYRDGRAFRYMPVADEAGLAARRVAALLDRAPDRQAVLSRLVADLSDADEQLLRRLLDQDGDSRSGRA